MKLAADALDRWIMDLGDEDADLQRGTNRGFHLSRAGQGEQPQAQSGVLSVCVLSDDFGGPWVQVDGTAEVIDLPEAIEPLVDYFR